MSNLLGEDAEKEGKYNLYRDIYGRNVIDYTCSSQSYSPLTLQLSVAAVKYIAATCSLR
jgi:hypothetical protein